VGEATSGKIIVTVGFLAVYFLIMIWAAFFSKTGRMNENSIEEFAVGGRNFSWIMVLFTMVGLFITASVYASWFSWGVFDGIFTQYLVVYSVFGFVFTYVFASKIWIWGTKFNLLTQPDYIQLRYRSRPLTTLFGAAAILIEAPWIIIEFAAMGYLVEAITYGAVTRQLGTIIIVVFVMSYIMYSGMKAVAVTELIQGILCSVVVSFGLIAIIYKLWGGIGPLYQQVAAVAPENLTISKGGTYSYPYWSSIIITASLGIMGWASFFSRIFTSKSIMDIKRVSWWSALISVIFCTLLLIVSLGGVVYPEFIEAAGTEIAFFVMADKAFGPVFLGLCAVVVVAAGMSLISVVMNSHSIIISENFIKPFRPESTSEQRVKAARWSTLIYSLIALGIALLNLPNLYTIAIVAYEGIAQVVPMVIFSLYWKRSNKYGALLGFLAGLITAVTVSAMSTLGGIELFAFSGGVIGLVANVAVHIVCGYVFPKDPHVDELFDVIEEYEGSREEELIKVPNITA